MKRETFAGTAGRAEKAGQAGWAIDKVLMGYVS